MSGVIRLRPRDAMLLYRKQRLEEEATNDRLIQPESSLPSPPSLSGNERQAKVESDVGRQDLVTAKNRRSWNAQTKGLAADQELDAKEMAERYLKVPGQAPPPATQGLLQTLADARKVRIRARHKIAPKNSTAQSNTARGNAGLHPGIWKTASGQPVTSRRHAPVAHRTHLPIQGSVAIV